MISPDARGAFRYLILTDAVLTDVFKFSPVVINDLMDKL